jgi:hypothetical protein
LFFHSRVTEVRTQEIEEVKIVCAGLGYGSWQVMGQVYECFTGDASIDLVTTPNSVVTSITHRNGSAVQTANQIEMLQLWSMRINFIPNNLKTMLPKLKAIVIYNARLLSISKENLQQFGDSLEFVNFGYNQLTSLDGDLFENNLNLKLIAITSNPITHIHPKFFETLKKMENIEYVGLQGLTCMNQIYLRENHGSITNFQWNNSDCLNEIDTTTELPIETTTEPETCDNCVIKYLDDSTQQINDNVNSNGKNVNKRLDIIETF